MEILEVTEPPVDAGVVHDFAFLFAFDFVEFIAHEDALLYEYGPFDVYFPVEQEWEILADIATLVKGKVE